MIHFVLATHPEAKPLIEYYNLKQIIKLKEFSVFVNNRNKISLTISGIGKIASASAIMYTFGYFQKKNSVWLNVGICGHISEKIGEIILVNKITDESTKKNWYPSIVFDHDLKMLGCTTHDIPNFDYNESIFEMELSGFYYAASKVSSNELIHSLKIISDNKKSKIEFKKKNEISNLIQKKILKIVILVKKLENLCKEIDDEKPCKKFDEIIQKNHYTDFQKIELRKLMKNLNFFKDKKVNNLLDKNYKAKEFILLLKQELKKIKYD